MIKTKPKQNFQGEQWKKENQIVCSIVSNKISIRRHVLLFETETDFNQFSITANNKWRQNNQLTYRHCHHTK